MPPPAWQCPDHQQPLSAEGAGSLAGACGCRFPVIGGIPRFVAAGNYARGFGLQWNAFRKTQLDSYTHTGLSRERLQRCLGGSFEAVRDKDVLEAGCGAGRFTEILLQEGARVTAADLSSAVEANRENCGGRAGYAVCQADILRLPLRPGRFDVVLCLGVVQHTPSPEATMRALCSQVRPGGLLVMDHYTSGGPTTLSRRALRRMLLPLPPRAALAICRGMVAALWPIHRLLWRCRNVRGVHRLRSLFLRLSPVMDFHVAYGELSPELLRTWAMLDTHDAVTDRFKHLRSAAQIAECLRACGMEAIETAYAGNGVEARARKPAGNSSP